jgi:hypothetical protein
MILAIEVNAPPLLESGRTAAQVHDRIENGTRRHAHQLALRVLDLHVHAAQSPLARTAVIVLNEIRLNSGHLELRQLPGLHKKPPCVVENRRLYEHYVRNTCFEELHG